MSNLLTPSGLLRGQGMVYLDHLPRSSKLRHQPHARENWRPDPEGLNLNETGQGLGLPKDCAPDLTEKVLHRTTSVYHWEYLSDSFQSEGNTGTQQSPTSQPSLLNNALPAPTEYPPFQWKPPDLREGGAWWHE